MSKKGQIEFGIAVLIAVVVGLLIISPFILKMFNSVLDPFSEAVNQTSEVAYDNVQSIKGDAVNFWDFIVLIMFSINILLLFLSAFLIDTHPFFVILFIIFGMFTFILFPAIQEILTQIYNDPTFALEVSQSPLVDWLQQNLGLVMVIVWLIVGVILYGKWRYGQQVY